MARFAICMNLIREPKILLLDEPFSALDVENRKRLRREMKTLKEKLGLSIVHVTHDLGEALSHADEVLPIVRGRITPGVVEVLVEGRPGRGCSVAHPYGGKIAGALKISDYLGNGCV